MGSALRPAGALSPRTGSRVVLGRLRGLRSGAGRSSRLVGTPAGPQRPFPGVFRGGGGAEAAPHRPLAAVAPYRVRGPTGSPGRGYGIEARQDTSTCRPFLVPCSSGGSRAQARGAAGPQGSGGAAPRPLTRPGGRSAAGAAGGAQHRPTGLGKVRKLGSIRGRPPYLILSILSASVSR